MPFLHRTGVAVEARVWRGNSIEGGGEGNAREGMGADEVTRCCRLKTMEDNAYGKMKQLLKWNDANLRKKIQAKEDSHGPRGEPGLPGVPGKDGKDGLPGRSLRFPQTLFLCGSLR